MIVGTLKRYVAMRFVNAALGYFVAVFVLVAMVDYIELLRRAGDTSVSPLLLAQASVFRVPQITERIIPFCVLVGAMSAYLTLSRRLELVVARSAGMSAWQFVAPSMVAAILLGGVVTFGYNPLSAALQEQAKLLEARLFGDSGHGLQQASGGSFWVTQRNNEGQAVINARVSLRQGAELRGVSVYQFDNSGRFRNRIDAGQAVLEPGYWRLQDAKVYAIGTQPRGPGEYLLATQLTPEEVRERFATPETIPVWNLPDYIERAERVGLKAAIYRLHFQKLLAQPFLFAAMVLLAAAVSLRFFRFGGIQKMILSGVIAGFLLFVIAKVIDDMAKADLVHPIFAAWLPILIGGLTGFVALLYQEDG